MTDDKSRTCIPFILDRLAVHRKHHTRPFFIGLNGIQGAGKTTLVSDLHSQLSKPPHSLRTLSVSIDDLYLTNKAQRDLARANPDNPLLQHRGQPGTHDLVAAKALFSALRNRETDVKIPVYDKSAFDGQGDRANQATWHTVNRQGEGAVDVVMFEGWCVGFRPLDDAELANKWRSAAAALSNSSSAQLSATEQARSQGKLGRQKLDNVHAINRSLREYDELTEQFDAFIHIDTDDIDCVYDWRLEQEHSLHQTKGTGMTDEQVIQFVNGYYPAYELFTDRLRAGVFPNEKGKHLRFVVGPDRGVLRTETL